MLYINTLRYLKFKQIVYRVFYFLKRRSLPAPGSGSPRHLPDSPVPGDSRFLFLPASPSYHLGAFTFLNVSKSFQDNIIWSFADYGKLWTYNLNYFDFLNQPDMSPEKGMELIRSFLAGMERFENPNRFPIL
jgi:hypothetical protein